MEEEPGVAGMRRKLHWRELIELQKNLLAERHHRRRCKRRRELDMGRGELTVSHPASSTIVS